jgi:hypothetical protein
VAVACVGTACGSRVPSGTDTVLQIPDKPTIIRFEADPPTIEDGGETVLSWEVNDPDAEITITPQGGRVTGDRLSVSPVVTTTYRLGVKNARGYVVDTLTVAVVPSSGAAPEPVTSSSNTGEWTSVTANLEGISSECGNLSQVVADPNSDRLIAGVALQGLWALDGESSTWSPLGQGQGSDEITNRTTSIVWDPEDPNTFWESGVYNGGGIYRTVDNGETFQLLGDISHIDLVSIDFTDPQRRTLVAGTHEQPVVEASMDSGNTWTVISQALTGDVGYASWPLVIDSLTYLLGTTRGAGAGIFRTTDGGSTWTQVGQTGVVGQPLVDRSDESIYWLLEGGQGMVRSDDDGLTWSPLTLGPSSTLSTSISQLPDGRVITIGNGSLITSADRGESWQRLGPPLPYDANGFTYSTARDAVYIWRWECVAEGEHLIPADAIMHLALDESD